MPDSRLLARTIAVYYFGIYLVILGIGGSFMNNLGNLDSRAVTFAVTAVFCYSLLYLLPALLLTGLFGILLLTWTRPATWKTLTLCATACFLGTGTVLFLSADRYLFSLYGYHFNASVWNLITTPGGIDSLGSTPETKIWAFVCVALLFAANSGILWFLCSRQGPGNFALPRIPYLLGAFSLLALVFCAEEGVYAYARFANDEPYLKAASIIPLHLDTTAVKFFKAVGVSRPPMQDRIRIAQGQIHYPARPLQTQPLGKYPNIVWLTAESFRWDLLDPEITPNLWKFSRRATTFNQHYSGGNRTRMGMFSMFYGLYAPYWYGFQEQKIRPQIMAQIAGDNYQMAIHTSQSFSYPELNDTVFAKIPAANMQELKDGPAWQRDHQNISDISQFIQARDSKRPFFTFMFFESTHAPYTFPDSAVIRGDYLQQVNYLQLNNITGNIQPLHNRYINAAHHVDAEVGRILNLLEEKRLLDNTIVLFTGDHGEEFMENGHWGHGHNEVFPETQVRVPLVLWIPGQEPRQVNYPTSHNQIPATILPLLGVTSPPLDYSSEESLFVAARPYRVIGSYDYLAVIDAEGKMSFPFTKADYFHYIFSDSGDNVIPLQRQRQLLLDNKENLDKVAEECNRFTVKGKLVALRE